MSDFLSNLEQGPAQGSTKVIKAPEHLNSTGCCIKYSDGKGRGVFASRTIPARTIVEISPVLLFSPEEYKAHGKYTALDHYTFRQRDGRMALALGLGSLFNHSSSPNVTYTMDTATESIRFTTTRTVETDEELCIFYGHNLWFNPSDAADHVSDHQSEPDDGWGGLTSIEDETGASNVVEDLFYSGNPNEIVTEEHLPFTRIKLTPDAEEEEDMDSIRKVLAWVVDVPNPRHTTTMLKWLRQSGHDTPSLAHLKRVRKLSTHSTLLVSTASSPPSLPQEPDLGLSEPYQLPVPRTAALTPNSLQLKNTLWPTVFAPRRKYEPEQWSRARARWALQAMRFVVQEARKAQESGELPIVSHVPAPFDDANAADATPSFTAHDTRTSASHPLRHSVLNVIRQVADYRNTSTPLNCPPSSASDAPPLAPAAASDPEGQNGQRYLLTSHSLFTTHEPCIMCSMALLHSRVKEVFYLIPMEKTGGCGGVACLPRLEAVNHRFLIGKWRLGKDGGVDAQGVAVGEEVDA